MRATGARKKRRYSQRLDNLFRSAVKELEQNGSVITNKLAEEAKKGSVSSTKLLLEFAEQEQETAEPDDSPPEVQKRLLKISEIVEVVGVQDMGAAQVWIQLEGAFKFPRGGGPLPIAVM